MDKDKKVKITQEQGQALLRLAAGFQLPEKLGEKNTYNIAERAVAADEVRSLFRELKSRSPLYARDRKLCFGPIESWTKSDGEGVQWVLTKADVEVEVRLDGDAINGVYWCLLYAMHPASPVCHGVIQQEEVLWPLAARLRLIGEIQSTMGLDKPTRRKLAFDNDSVEEAGGKEKAAPPESQKK